jgi:protein-tyrosine-phosphatase
MTARYNVLFLCTGNSARSILAEAILNRIGEGAFEAYSAGSMPKGEVHPQTIALLKRLRYPTEDLRSKSWDEFTRAGALKFDFVITVCDDAAREVCPAWPGQPMTAHWGVPDPASVAGNETEIAAAFKEAHRVLHRRVELFTALPFDKLDRFSLKHRVDAIGKTTDATPA